MLTALLSLATGTALAQGATPKEPLTEQQVRVGLSAAGYTNVHDIDYEDGIWNAEADDASGKDVELKIDPATGKVIGKEKD